MGTLHSKKEPELISMKAALLIQAWYRRYVARMEARRRYTWNIFQNLEYRSEQDQVELYNFFNALLTHMPVEQQKVGYSRAASPASDGKFVDESDDGEHRDSFEIIKGPVIELPLSKKDVNTLIDLFRKKKYDFHAKFVGLILREAASQLKRLPNLNHASIGVSKQITIIGDLHGKLDDLLVIFHKNGLPSLENPYIFNGDFVDRGKKGLEVLLLLLVCYMVFPGAVYLNRGNHEDSVMNARYGFIKEVHMKYKNNAEKLLRLIEEVYRFLPLGTIINNKVFVVHGGISDTTNLDLIKSLDRGKYVSILRPPVGDGDEIDKTEWKQIFDIMWSDPRERDGCEPNTLRGAGTYFGPDITDKFLSQNKLKYLVRSHECKPDGYEFIHHDKVITIFSASNYYAIGSNKGAYLKFNPMLEPYFVQYISAASKTRKMTFQQKVGIIESSAIRELGARLRAKRNEIEKEFLAHDPDRTGQISITHWCESMENATGLGLPWRHLREKLAPMPDNAPSSNKVHYQTTLELLETDIIIQAQKQETTVAESLYKNKGNLEAIFYILDKDGSGQVSMEEFSEAIDLLAVHLPGASNKEQFLHTCKLMDLNNDGQVDLNEFLEAFRIVDQQRSFINNSTETPQKKKRESLVVSQLAATLAPSDVIDKDKEEIGIDYVSRTLRPKIVIQ